MANVLVTGASGRLGRPLLAALGASGHRAMGCGFLAADLPRADLRDAAQVSAILASTPRCDTIVHLAALAHVDARTDPRALEAVNVQGTRNLLAEAERVGVEHFVLASSIDVYSPRSLLAGPVDETVPPAPATAYGRTKAEAEAAVAAWANGVRRVSIVRLAPLYGETLLTDLRKRVVLLANVGYRYAPARPRHSLCHLDNAVEGMLRILERPPSRPAVYNVRDVSYASQDDIRAYLAAAGAAPAFSVRVPTLVARPWLALASAARSPLPPVLRSRLVKAFGQSLIEIEPLRALGYDGSRGLPTQRRPRLS